MIYLNIDNQDYYDDVRVLVKSFYPQEETTVQEEDMARGAFSLSVSDGRIVLKASMDGHNWEREAVSHGNDKRAVREAVKNCLYLLLCDITGKTLPWGMLTGVRPAKIVMKMLEEGRSRQHVRDIMKSHYYVSDEKTELSLEVAEKELSLLGRLNYDGGYSLYIGIPFCPTTCLYCSFTSYPLSVWRDRVDTYLDALIKEIEAVSAYFKGRRPDTVYFGGGTPTTLEPCQLDRLLNALYENFDLSRMPELTVEAGRPDSVTEEKLLVLRKYGVSRISINPQTMKQETLDLIGRFHTVTQVKEAYRLARKCGFDNINMDLIAGLPNEDYADVENTMKEIMMLAPDSITVHSLAVKRAAALKTWQKKNATCSITNTDEIINMTAWYARLLGLEPYYLYRQKNMAGNFENVGYARKGYECLYNILIMEEKQTIVALGSGASSKFVFPAENRIERVENVKDVKNYIERIDEMIEKKCRFIKENRI